MKNFSISLSLLAVSAMFAFGVLVYNYSNNRKNTINEFVEERVNETKNYRTINSLLENKEYEEASKLIQKLLREKRASFYEIKTYEDESLLGIPEESIEKIEEEIKQINREIPYH